MLQETLDCNAWVWYGCYIYAEYESINYQLQHSLVEVYSSLVCLWFKTLYWLKTTQGNLSAMLLSTCLVCIPMGKRADDRQRKHMETMVDSLTLCGIIGVILWITEGAFWWKTSLIETQFN